MIARPKQIAPAHSRGRPVAQDPRCKRVTIQFTRSEYEVVARSAGNIPLGVYGRNVLLKGRHLDAEHQQRTAEAWRTLDLLSEHLFRVDDALQGGRRPDEDELMPLLGDVLDALDEVRILLAAQGPVS